MLRRDEPRPPFGIRLVRVLSKMDSKRVDITDLVAGMWSMSSERRVGANIWRRSSGLLSYGWVEDFVIDDFGCAALSDLIGARDRDHMASPRLGPSW